MIRRPPRSTRTDTLLPYTTLFRSLYVGTIEPRKNVLGLIEAYSRSSFNIRSRYPLVLSGHEGWRSEAIHTRIQQAERSEEHTSELQSLMRISYAVFCLKKTKRYINHKSTNI